MIGPDTALERRAEDPDPDPDPDRRLALLGLRLAGVLQRREAAGERRPVAAGPSLVGGPLGDRLLDAFERRLTRAVERRLGAGPSGRTPGALEQRLVTALERRLRPGGRPSATELGPLARVGRGLRQHRPGSRLPAARPRTLRALAVAMVARGVVRALVLFVRLLGRGLVSAPIRALARMLTRRAVRARTSRQAGLLALLLGAIAVLIRALRGRLGAVVQTERPAVPILRLLRALLPVVRRLGLGLLRRLLGCVHRELGGTPGA